MDSELELANYAQKLKDENELLRSYLDKLDQAVFRNAGKNELRLIIYNAFQDAKNV